MYGLPQAGTIANDLIKKRLEPHGYIPCNHTPGLWKQTSRPTMFTLVVDDFGVKVTSENDAAHIIKTLQKYYKITIDKEGKHYLGMDLEWDYIKRTLEIAMKGYVQAACKRFNHKNQNNQFMAHQSILHRHMEQESNTVKKIYPDQ